MLCLWELTLFYSSADDILNLYLWWLVSFWVESFEISFYLFFFFSKFHPRSSLLFVNGYGANNLILSGLSIIKESASSSSLNESSSSFRECIPCLLVICNYGEFILSLSGLITLILFCDYFSLSVLYFHSVVVFWC